MQPSPSARDILVLAQIVDLVRAGSAMTRPELKTVTGLGRTVVNDRVREGIDRCPRRRSRRRRPGERRGRPVAQPPVPHRGRRDPGGVPGRGVDARRRHGPPRPRPDPRVPPRSMPRTGRRRCCAPSTSRSDRLLRRLDEPAPVWAVAVGLPGADGYPTGRVAALRTIAGLGRIRRPAPGSPPATTHPLWVDNEVQPTWRWASGSAAFRRSAATCSTSRSATGIGSGLVTDGRLHRGDSGAAGDIGHVRVTDDPDRRLPLRQDRLPQVAGRRVGPHPRTHRAGPRRDSAILAERLTATGSSPARTSAGRPPPRTTRSISRRR